MMGTNRHMVGDLRYDVQLFDCDLIDFVHDIEDGTVLPVAFDDINEIVDCCITVDPHLCIQNAILFEHRGYGLLIAVLERITRCDAKSQATLLSLLKRYCWRLLVDADPKAFELILDLPLVNNWLHDVQDNEDEAAAHCRANDLLPAALAILCPLDDTRQVKQLDLRALVVEDAGHAGEGRELVGRDLALLARHLVQERRLAHGREAHEAHPRVARLGDLEARGARAPAAAAAALCAPRPRRGGCHSGRPPPRGAGGCAGHRGVPPLGRLGAGQGPLARRSRRCGGRGSRQVRPFQRRRGRAVRLLARWWSTMVSLPSFTHEFSHCTVTGSEETS
mmetsp:Transcript_53469/g.155898  ORF Transcript_53469/g.155898 Transcript_53469/m.155898 type:complete len:335 (+) Transcript_53469:452-1456(+)